MLVLVAMGDEEEEEEDEGRNGTAITLKGVYLIVTVVRVVVLVLLSTMEGGVGRGEKNLQKLLEIHEIICYISCRISRNNSRRRGRRSGWGRRRSE